MTIEQQLSALSDAELDQQAADIMEPDVSMGGAFDDPGLMSVGGWHEYSLSLKKWRPAKSITGSLDVAALLEAKVIETVGRGRGVLWDKLWKVVVACSESIDTIEALQRCARATARQRTIAALACLDDHIPDAGEKDGKEKGKCSLT